MNRPEPWTAAIVLGAAIALVDLVTGWTANGSVLALVVVFGLLGATIALYTAMVVTGIRYRRRIASTAGDPKTVLAQAARGMRWSGVFAIAFCVLLFANCSSGATTGPNVHVTAVSQDPAPYLWLTASLLGPLVLALLLVPALTTGAQLLAAGRPEVARRLGRLAMWASGAAAVVAFLSVGAGFFFGVSQCDLGPSAGGCVAGASSLMNFLSLGSLALFLPYVGLVNWALAQMKEQAR